MNEVKVVVAHSERAARIALTDEETGDILITWPDET